jgi:hypothetical protein
LMLVLGSHSKLQASLVTIRCLSRTVFTKTEAPASLDALVVLDTSRRRVRSLRTVPAVLSSDEGGRSSACFR